MKRTLFVALALACLAAFLPALDAPFVFDDLTAIQENASIRQLWPLTAPLTPPRGGETVQGRPILNLSFALNYAAGGLDVRGYHAVNVVVHTIAAVLLFALVDATLRHPPLVARFGEHARLVAFAVALLWAIHPLQTSAVTYLSRRADSLAGMFVLLTLVAFVRGHEDNSRRLWWNATAIASCALGVATKEAVAVAPVLVLLYDRTFIAGSFRLAWRERWSLYAGLASTWLLLAALLVANGNRGGTAGFGTSVSWTDYALTQADAITRYLGLTFWPHPLVFDYGTSLVRDPFAVWPQLLLVSLLAGVTIILLWRAPLIGFLGAWFFVTLTPASSVVPVATQTIAEHRMYLPLAAVVALVVGAVARHGGRRAIVGALSCAVLLGIVTVRRNLVYRSELALWTDTVNKCPENSRAQNAYARALTRAGRDDEAIAAFARAVALAPESAEAQSNLGSALVSAGRIDEAIKHLREAVRLAPDSFAPRANLAGVLQQSGQLAEAIEHFTVAARLDSGVFDVHYRLAMLLARSGRTTEALPCFEAAVALQPDHVGVRNNFANTLLLLRRPNDAIPHYEAALRLAPSAPTHSNLAMAFLLIGENDKAEAHYEAALALDPAYPPARDGLTRIKGRVPSVGR